MPETILDDGPLGALMTALPRGAQSSGGVVRLGNLFQALRDRVVQRSQLGKRKLDVAFTRRELDARLLELGDRYRRLAREGRAAVPAEIEALVGAVRELEERLEREKQEVARLGRERSSETSNR